MARELAAKLSSMPRTTSTLADQKVQTREYKQAWDFDHGICRQVEVPDEEVLAESPSTPHMWEA